MYSLGGFLYMKMQRTRNATRNIIFGTFYRVIATIGPFVVRTVMLYFLGVDYLGLNSLFTSLLSFLSLAELGVGSAMVYAMYKPIAEDDIDSVCALLKLYKKLYRIIGAVILGIGVCLLPFINKLVSGTVPNAISLFLLYGIYLFNTVISYFLFSYKQSVLMAYQRNDIISRQSLVVQLIMYLFQIGALVAFRNYYIYIILLPIFTIITNFVNSIIVDKLYPQILCKGKVDKKTAAVIKRNILALIGGKLSNTVLHSSDNLVLSIFIGLRMVAIYGNYYYIINAVVGFTEVIYTSLTAGLGNSIVTEPIEKNYDDFNVLSFLNTWLVTWCCTCFMCLMQPFMALWVGEDLLFPEGMVVLFVVYFYLYQINKIVLTYKDAAGLWYQDRFRPYVVMGTNLILNVMTVQRIGIYGVILSTIISLIISIPWSTYTVFRYLFKTDTKKYYLSFFKNVLVAVFTCLITYKICNMVNRNEIFMLFERFALCCVIPNVVLLLANIRNPFLKLGVLRIQNSLVRKD